MRVRMPGVDSLMESYTSHAIARVSPEQGLSNESIILLTRALRAIK